ncbi:hypothetical protein DFJ74DRAFT_649941 [Hyaloraphidium curvatum]|nr:hypothetical protein DFJ74DRAFT_649941 [Hyaloraphidium curvatum]
MFAGTWVFNDGRFGTRQLITGTVAYVVSNFGVTLAVLASVAAAALMERSYGLGSWRVRASGGADGPEERLAGDAKILDDDVYAGLARWLELVGAPRSDGAVDAEGATEGCKELPRLLRHDPTDKLCPCPAPGCAGQLLPRVELAEAFATLFVALGLGVALWLTAHISPMIAFAPQSWPFSGCR